MTEPLVIRCSSTDRVMTCASSLTPTATPYNPETDEAREGNAAHEVLAGMVAGVDVDLEAVARHYHVDRDALFLLLHRGRQAWAQVRQWYPEAVAEWGTERFLGFVGERRVILRGTADVASIVGAGFDGAKLAVLDWKAGWRPTDHPRQLMSYAHLAAGCDLAAEEVLAIEVWLRLGKLEVHRFTRADLDRHAQELLAQVERSGEQWGPGPDACQYCPLQLTCSAKADYDRAAVEALMPIAGDRYPAGRELVGALWEKRCSLRRALDRFDAMADAELDAGGPIQLGDGWQLERVSEERTRVLPSRSLAYLRDVVGLTDEQADRVLTIGKGKLETAVKELAPRRGGAASWRKALADLEQLGAIEPYIHTEKRAVKATPKGT